VQLEDEHRQVLRPAEYRVAAFAVEHHPQPVRSGGFGEQQVRHGKRVTDRTVQKRHGVGKPSRDRLAGHDQHPMSCVAMGRDQAGVRQLVGSRPSEADRVGEYVLVVRLCGQSGHQAAVDTAGEQHPDRLGGRQPSCRRLLQ
jgi:hypothetical protein